MNERKGFLTPEQEEKIDRLIKLSKFGEAFDGIAIRLADNQGLERLKSKITEKYPDILPEIYEVIDTIIEAIPEKKEE